jgi:hypothetical protein
MHMPLIAGLLGARFRPLWGSQIHSEQHINALAYIYPFLDRIRRQSYCGQLIDCFGEVLPQSSDISREKRWMLPFQDGHIPYQGTHVVPLGYQGPRLQHENAHEVSVSREDSRITRDE